jgi:rhomboid protease GluP
MSHPDLEPQPLDTFRILDQELRFARLMASRTYATLGLLLLLGLVFVLAVAAADVLTARFRTPIPYDLIVVLGAKNNAALEAGELWRLGTSVLLHGDLLHLGVNAYALYVLGTVLERLYGRRRFLLVFFVSGLGGALASYGFTAQNSVGASGAIFGLLGAAVVFGFRFRGVLPARIRRVLTVGLLPWVAINVVIGFVIPVIDNAAHLGGMATGASLALVLGTPLQARRGPAGAAALQWAIVVGAVVAMGASVVAGVWAGVECASSLETLEACFLALVP